MVSGLRFITVFAVLAALLAACSPITPTLSDSERQELAQKATPYANDVGYTQALTRLGKMIEAIPEGNVEKINIQAKPIGNTSISSETGGESLPLNITNMVITALNNLASRKRILVIPYDPNYYQRSKEADVVVGASQLTPNLVLAGSITEFDKDVEGTDSGANFDISDGGKAATDVSASANNSRKMSRVTLDLYLIDARLNVVIPGLSVSNTVNVMELDKGREFSFRIFGGGFGVNGTLTNSQGFQRAVRNLVGYSVVQLLGRFYDLPYESLLGLTTNDPLIKRNAHTAQQPAVAAPQPEPTVAPQPAPPPRQPVVQRTAAQPPAPKAARSAPKPHQAKPAPSSAQPALPDDLDARMRGLE
jgi:hypothetical protein